MNSCIYRVYWMVNGRTREEFCKTRVERDSLLKVLEDLDIKAGYDYPDGQIVGSIVGKSTSLFYLAV
jgi:Holliday junction resolvase RusA-like endonuclease